MPKRSLIDKLSILADAAKYDASCASSGTTKRDSRGKAGIGSSGGMGICHAYAPDGRCISLLKVLLTNFCIYDCRYCVNRVSSNVERARFSPKELAQLTIDFYKRNYIEGLFLSSGIIRNADYTMEQINEVARLLREEHHFRGYIHLKTIPEAAPELIEAAGRLADRLSINIELPTETGLRQLAPEKTGTSIRRAMAGVKTGIQAATSDPGRSEKARRARTSFSPSGQSSQMIVGADASDDGMILKTAAGLYAGYSLKRVYYSAFSPIPDASGDLPPQAPPLKREHRLYQADWMFQFYGFDVEEIVPADGDAMLDLDLDPKLAWALRNRHLYPLDLNTADRELLLRVPGLGPRSVDRILQARRNGLLRLDGVKRIARSIRKSLPFIQTIDYSPGGLTDSADLRARFAPPAQQLQLI